MKGILVCGFAAVLKGNVLQSKVAIKFFCFYQTDNALITKYEFWPNGGWSKKEYYHLLVVLDTHQDNIICAIDTV